MKNTIFVRLAGFFGLIIAGILMGSLVQGLYLHSAGLSSSVFSPGGMEELKGSQLKIVLAIGHLFTFFLPPLLFAWIRSKGKPAGYLNLDASFHLPAYLWSVFLLISVLPWVQYLQELNAMIDLPEWARFMEQDATAFIDILLRMESPGQLLSTLLIVAVLPAIGEELLFRGCLQNEIEQSHSLHLAVWTSALLFSTFHLQFAGFFPRLGLGLVLGYLYGWTRSLWVPIFIHFVFNGLQVVIVYFVGTELLGSDKVPASGSSTWALVLSSFFVFWAGRQLIERRKPNKDHE